MRVIVTRPAAQAEAWVAELRAVGLDAVALPLIGIAPPQDLAAVHRAWQQLPGLALVMFVSTNAVEQFFAARPEGCAWPAHLPAASTGPGTTAALRTAGVACVQEPAADAPQFDSEALWARMGNRSWAGCKVLVVRGEQGRDWLAQQLQAAGAQVAFVSGYRRLPPVLDAAGLALLRAALAEPAAHCWLFSSSEAVGHLQRLVPAASWRTSHALASHPRIVQAARGAGFGQVDEVAPGVAALLDLLGGR
jgi:uroporphyrinogen-III synthase